MAPCDIMSPRKEIVSSSLFGVGACIFFAAFVMGLRFYAVGSSVPDPNTGRIFPVRMHGILYVQRDQGEWFYGLLAISIALGILSFLVRRYGNPLSKGAPKSDAD